MTALFSGSFVCFVCSGWVWGLNRPIGLDRWKSEKMLCFFSGVVGGGIATVNKVLLAPGSQFVSVLFVIILGSYLFT